MGRWKGLCAVPVAQLTSHATNEQRNAPPTGWMEMSAANEQASDQQPTCIRHVCIQPHGPPVLLLHRHVVAGQRRLVLKPVLARSLQSKRGRRGQLFQARKQAQGWEERRARRWAWWRAPQAQAVDSFLRQPQWQAVS